MKPKPVFIVMSAPSGCGKSTLIDLLLQEYHDLQYSVSCTTRAPRDGEEDGIDYHFLSESRFRELLAEDAFLENAEVHGNLYGTLKQPIAEMLAEGSSVIMDIDVVGADKVRHYVMHHLPPEDPMRAGYMDVFIKPPSMETLRERLEGRGLDAPDVIERRLANAEGEMARAGEYMFQVVNDDLQLAFRRLCDLIDIKTGRM